jgi:hypothetical protein
VCHWRTAQRQRLIGYGYTSSMQTMRIEAGSADGTSQGKPKRIHAITLRLHETVGIEVGNSPSEERPHLSSAIVRWQWTRQCRSLRVTKISNFLVGMMKMTGCTSAKRNPCQ